MSKLMLTYDGQVKGLCKASWQAMLALLLLSLLQLEPLTWDDLEYILFGGWPDEATYGQLALWLAGSLLVSVALSYFLWRVIGYLVGHTYHQGEQLHFDGGYGQLLGIVTIAMVLIKIRFLLTMLPSEELYHRFLPIGLLLTRLALSLWIIAMSLGYVSRGVAKVGSPARWRYPGLSRKLVLWLIIAYTLRTLYLWDRATDLVGVAIITMIELMPLGLSDLTNILLGTFTLNDDFIALMTWLIMVGIFFFTMKMLLTQPLAINAQQQRLRLGQPGVFIVFIVGWQAILLSSFVFGFIVIAASGAEDTANWDGVTTLLLAICLLASLAMGQRLYRLVLEQVGKAA
jgi:hypothetical protein